MSSPVATGAHADVDPRRSPSPHHRGAIYLDCETTGVDVGAQITCVAITCESGKTTTWHSGHAEHMTREIASTIVDFILESIAAGNKLYTFNGAAFDLRLLHALSGRDELKQVALTHCDVLVDFVADARYYSSMNSFALATLGADGSKTNTGAWAATAWFDGHAQEVLQYCAEDTLVLKRLVNHVKKYGKLQRLTKAGKSATWVLPSLNGSVRTVAEALASASAVPAWLSDPPALPDVAWAQ